MHYFSGEIKVCPPDRSAKVRAGDTCWPTLTRKQILDEFSIQDNPRISPIDSQPDIGYNVNGHIMLLTNED
jgi:hypothetical protein